MKINLKKSILFLGLCVISLQQIQSEDGINSDREDRFTPMLYQTFEGLNDENQPQRGWCRKHLCKIVAISAGALTIAATAITGTWWYMHSQDHKQDSSSFFQEACDGYLSNTLTPPSSGFSPYLEQIVDVFVKSATGMLVQQAIGLCSFYAGNSHGSLVNLTCCSNNAKIDNYQKPIWMLNLEWNCVNLNMNGTDVGCIEVNSAPPNTTKPPLTTAFPSTLVPETTIRPSTTAAPSTTQPTTTAVPITQAPLPPGCVACVAAGINISLCYYSSSWDHYCGCTGSWCTQAGGAMCDGCWGYSMTKEMELDGEPACAGTEEHPRAVAFHLAIACT